MSIYVFVTRRADPLKPDGAEISREEWVELVESDPDLSLEDPADRFPASRPTPPWRRPSLAPAENFFPSHPQPFLFRPSNCGLQSSGYATLPLPNRWRMPVRQTGWQQDRSRNALHHWLAPLGSPSGTEPLTTGRGPHFVGRTHHFHLRISHRPRQSPALG